MADVRVNRYTIKLKIFPTDRFLTANCTIRIKNIGKAPIETLGILLNKGLSVVSVSINDLELPFTQGLTLFEDIEGIEVNFVRINFTKRVSLGEELTLSIRYEGGIQSYENVFRYVKDKISAEYTLIRPDAFSYPIIGVPNFSRLVNMILSQSFDYEIEVSVPHSYTVANVGKLMNKKMYDDLVTYKFKSKLPSWRIDIAIADFEIIRDSEIDLTIFALRDDIEHAKRLLNHTKRVLEFYISNFGKPPINWKGYTIIEIPAGWGNQADVCGMLLNKESFVNPEEIRGLYHEIAHLWNVKTREKTPSRFLDEAFASYFQALAEEKLLGKNLNTLLERARRRIIEMCEKTPILKTTPVSEYGKYKITDAVYYIGVWVLYLLNKIVGDACFKKMIQKFLNDYKESGATLEDFVKVANKTCGEYLDQFFNDWLFGVKGIHYLLEELPVSEIIDKYTEKEI